MGLTETSHARRITKLRLSSPKLTLIDVNGLTGRYSALATMKFECKHDKNTSKQGLGCASQATSLRLNPAKSRQSHVRFKPSPVAIESHNAITQTTRESKLRLLIVTRTGFRYARAFYDRVSSSADSEPPQRRVNVLASASVDSDWQTWDVGGLWGSDV